MCVCPPQKSTSAKTSCAGATASASMASTHSRASARRAGRFSFLFLFVFFFLFLYLFFCFLVFCCFIIVLHCIVFFFRAVEKTKFAKVPTSFPIALIDSTSSRTGADINECIGVDCGGAGICHNLVNHFSCTCSKGWAGGGLNERCTGSKIEIDSK